MKKYVYNEEKLTFEKEKFNPFRYLKIQLKISLFIFILILIGKIYFIQ